MGVVPTGGEQLIALSRALDKAGEKGLARVLDEGFRTPLRELVPVLEASQFHVMPKRGGMARVARERTGFTVRKVGTGAYPGMRLAAKQRGRIRRQDQGVLRHPVFPDPDKPRDEWEWINQPIEPGWFSDPTKAAQAGIRSRSEAVLRDVARQVEVEVSKAARATPGAPTTPRR